MTNKLKSAFIFCLIVILICSPMAGSLILLPSFADETRSTEKGESERSEPRAVVGPMQLLKNSQFSSVSNWEWENATEGGNPIVYVSYDNVSDPDHMYYGQLWPITTLPFTHYAYLNQTFTKPIWTPDYPSAVVCKLKYNLKAYTGDIGGSSVIFGELFLQIRNTTSGQTGEWSIATGTTNQFTTDDAAYPDVPNRLNNPQHPVVYVGQKQPSFSICPPGTYELSLRLKISTIFNSGFVMFILDLRIDDVYLYINDTYEPLVTIDNTTLGPYNTDPVDRINVSFDSGGLENTSLKVAKYRENNTGTPGQWHTIFRQSHEIIDTYSTNWSITPIWNSLLVEGENTLDLYVMDDVGNYNDSVQLTIVKDTNPPVSNASALDEYFYEQQFNIYYNASDPIPNGGYNNTVELWFEYEDQGSYVQYKPPWLPSGLFNDSIILFNITQTGAGTGFAEGKYDFYTIGVDNATNREDAPGAANPDATTIIDYSLPVSNASELPASMSTKTFDIEYTASDSGSGLDHVELWYILRDQWLRWNGTNNEGGNFTSRPISFTAATDGVYEFVTVAYDKSGHIEKNGTPVKKPPKVSDAITFVDTQPPYPVFIKPDKKHIKGAETILVTSDFDTQYIKFEYWIDWDEDGTADNDDIDDLGVKSTWNLINNISEPEEANNWSTQWDTSDIVRFPEFKSEEHLVVLRATGVDQSKSGFTDKGFIEVDNIPPFVNIITPRSKTAENGDSISISYSSDNDVNITRFYYTETNADDPVLPSDPVWINIKDNFKHPYGETDANYIWDISKIRGDSPVIFIKTEAIDDTENVGEDIVGPIYVNRGGPEPRQNFPTNISLDEDFPEYKLKLTDFEAHSNPEYTGDNLKWYVTGNSNTIFFISGDNSTGKDADTFTYTSILNKYGSETLTFHLVDPLDLEATIEQTVWVNPVNDPPDLDFPTDTIHVTHSMSDTLELWMYISDVDNKMSDLSMSLAEQSEYITVSALNLTFNYPSSMDGKTKLIQMKVSDGKDISNGNIQILITNNHRPRWIKLFPNDLVLNENERRENYLDLDDYFTDDDGDALYYTATSKKINVEIDPGTNQVTFTAKQNVEGLEKVWFRARDPHGGFADGFMIIKILNINDPVIIKPIPDMYIHWSEEGYGYDFSYFVYDPDNARSELTAWVSSGIEEQDVWFDVDPENNMRILFKFPFSAAGKTYPLTLNVMDPSNLYSFKLFNVTVIVDNWPVEQTKIIEDQYFPEDGQKENAFDLWDYFVDIDGGTNFEILDDPGHHIKAGIDENNYVDLATDKKDWNTGEGGFAELVIIARDTQPVQAVYSIVRVFVIPVNDPPVLNELGAVNMTEKEEKTMNLENFIYDVDTPISSLSIEIDATENVEVSGTLLIFKYSKAGKYTIKVWVIDTDGTRSQTRDLTINVLEKETTDQGIPAWMMYSIVALVIIIILILVIFFLVFTHYKVQEVFLIHKSGILLSHLSSERKPGRDEEILSGMFTAVQEFIRDSFATPGTPGGEGDHILKEMKIGEHNNILIERGKYIYLAVIFRGRGGGKLRSRVRNILNSIETQYESAFTRWVGDMDKIAGVEKYLKPLLPTGATQVMTSEKQLGRVTPPPSPGVITPGTRAPAAAPPTPARAIAPAPARQAITPAQPTRVLMPAAAPPKPISATQAQAVTPKPVAPAPAMATAKPPAAAAPAAPAAAAPAAPKCPKCGAVPNKFPDGSMFCPRCGYTGN